MPIVERLEGMLTSFPRVTPSAAELARLQQFFTEMKDAHIAKTREYDLPRPDTLGRAASSFTSQRHSTRR